MKALIPVADGVEDLELFYPLYRLREEGIEVEVAGPEIKPVTGKHGYSVTPDILLSECGKNKYDLLIIPGGKAPETFRRVSELVDVVCRMMSAGKPVAAICHGAQLLISADVLKGKQATCWQGIRDDIIAAGAEYQDQEVVVDGNLVTSRCPDDLPAFCRELFGLIKQQAASGSLYQQS